MDIRVVDIRLSPCAGKALRAFADVKFGELILKDFRVMKGNGGGVYVMAPFVAYKDKGGKLRFRQIVDLPTEVRGRVDTAILGAFYQREKETQDGKAL